MNPIYLDYPTKLEPGTGRGFLIGKGVFGGLDVWSDGWVMFTGKPPQDATADKSMRWDQAIANADPGGMPEIKPLVVSDEGDCFVVWFSEKIVINHKFYRATMERWPDAIFYGDGKEDPYPTHVVIFSNGSRVGLIARRRQNCVAPRVQRALQSANAGKPQAVNDPPEEHQKQEEQLA